MRARASFPLGLHEPRTRSERELRASFDPSHSKVDILSRRRVSSDVPKSAYRAAPRVCAFAPIYACRSAASIHTGPPLRFMRATPIYTCRIPIRRSSLCALRLRFDHRFSLYPNTRRRFCVLATALPAVHCTPLSAVAALPPYSLYITRIVHCTHTAATRLLMHCMLIRTFASRKACKRPARPCLYVCTDRISNWINPLLPNSPGLLLSLIFCSAVHLTDSSDPRGISRLTEITRSQYIKLNYVRIYFLCLYKFCNLFIFSFCFLNGNMIFSVKYDVFRELKVKESVTVFFFRLYIAI